MSAAHLFLDESKHRDYVIVASAVLPDRLSDARRDLRGLVLRGQSRLHFYKESPTRRRLILAAIAATGARATVYSAAGYRRDSDARAACLAGVITDAVQADAHLLVLEQDDSILHWDRKQLFDLTRAAGTTLRYEHQRGRSEPLLWMPDAIAWCWARGGEWRALAEPLIDHVCNVRTARSPAHQPSGRLPGSLPRSYSRGQHESYRCCRRRHQASHEGRRPSSQEHNLFYLSQRQ